MVENISSGQLERKFCGSGEGRQRLRSKTLRRGVLMLPDTIKRAVGSLPIIVRSGRRVNGLYRLMKAPLLWERAYHKIAQNKGAMTPGVDGQTPRQKRYVRSSNGWRMGPIVRNQYVGCTFPKPTARKGRLACRRRKTAWSRRSFEFFWRKSMSRCSRSTLMGLDRIDPVILRWKTSEQFGQG